jgi:hypothetical protein
MCTPLSSSIRATCPAHLILLDFTSRLLLFNLCNKFSFSLLLQLHASNFSNCRPQ